MFEELVVAHGVFDLLSHEIVFSFGDDVSVLHVVVLLFLIFQHSIKLNGFLLEPLNLGDKTGDAVIIAQFSSVVQSSLLQMLQLSLDTGHVSLKFVI